jgi:hypothetical protein
VWRWPYGENDDLLSAILLLLHRPWFERLWIRQEVHFSEHAIIQCGIKEIPWSRFRDAAYCLHARQGDFESRERKLSSLKTRLDLVLQVANPHKRYWLPDLLYDTQTSHCSDPRDRIYAMLGLLVKRHQNLGIKPDYSLSVQQIFRDVLLLDVQCGRSLSMLCCCRLTEGSSLRGLPSWVPDPTDRTRPTPLYYSRAHGGINPHATLLNEATLEVSGIQVGVIGYVHPMGSTDPSLRRRVIELCQLLEDVNFTWSYVGGGTQLHAYNETLCTGRFSERHNPLRKDLLTRLDAENALRRLGELWAFFQTPSEDTFRVLIDDKINKLLSIIFTQTQERAFFRTQEGYIGVGSKSTQPGDLVYILLGCALPMILRPLLSDKDSHARKSFNVVGDAYCAGIMDGEAILGPLPEHLQCQLDAHANNSKFPFRIRDMQTGVVQPCDSRIASVFGDIQDQVDEDGDLNIEFHALRRADIPVQKVCLV